MATESMTHDGTVQVTVGVDTHKDVHVARAKDQLGRLLGEVEIPTTPVGYRRLLQWARGYGVVAAFGVEGTGSYGAGLTRFLRQQHETVLEVIRPNRQRRRRHGKSDPADADAAASAVLAGEASGPAKASDTAVEMIRVLRVTRTTAVKARVQTTNCLKALLVTAPAELRDALRHLPTSELIRTCARTRPGPLVDATAATKTALRSLAGRHRALTDEIAALDVELTRLTAVAAPDLVACFGVGTDSAAALLITAGDRPDRLTSEASFAMLCGVAPVEASSGQTVRHRLNRGGDRRANSALYHVVMVRLRHHEATKAYVARRTADGKSKREIMRCLKRYVAREVYHILRTAVVSRTPLAA